MNDLVDVESLLTEAMRARTANVRGDPASLSGLRMQLQSRQSKSVWLMLAAAVACAVAIVAAFAVATRFTAGETGGTTATYPASQYMLASRSNTDGSEALSIVRLAGLHPVRALHVRLDHAQLTADGRFVYGVGAAGKTQGIV